MKIQNGRKLAAEAHVPVCCIFPPDEINMRSETLGSRNLSPLVLKYLACTGFLDRFVFSGEKIRHLEI
ncbi:hypothetical protein P5673_001886 [Acropora cervicornis]|uniref:Uncharacterized protein n=1 Tax=Acropora cervicornis TaxID=6130 RepID=A0AAD9VFT5_ACRCE|nr:hypothetical protein P5673_001886 [Acropora cervicornis]